MKSSSMLFKNLDTYVDIYIESQCRNMTFQTGKGCLSMGFDLLKTIHVYGLQPLESIDHSYDWRIHVKEDKLRWKRVRTKLVLGSIS